jgi:hypothetical protein
MFWLYKVFSGRYQQYKHLLRKSAILGRCAVEGDKWQNP